MEAIGEAQIRNTKSKMAEIWFALFDKIVVDKQKLNVKKENHDLINANVVECLGIRGK